MGQMHLAPFNNEFFPIWGIILLIVYGSVDSISSFTLGDNELWKKQALEYYFQFNSVCWLVISYWKQTDHIVLVTLLSFATLCKASERVLASQMSSKRGLVRKTKPVADFMKFEHQLSENPDPINNTGYKYVINWEYKHEKEFVKGILSEEVVTIESVWKCSGSLLNNDGDPDSKSKDTCLSFVLCNLLCSCFAGFPLPEYSQPQDKTWRFVKDGLLREGDSAEKPFRVIELELAFLYDIFYTKSALIFDTVIIRLIVVVLILVSDCYLAVVILGDYSETREILQILLFVISNWGKVIFLSNYVGRPFLQRSKLYETIVKFVCSIPRPKPWGRKLCQYSLLKSFNYKPSFLHNVFFWATFADHPGRKYKESSPVEVSKAVKAAVSRLDKGQ
ncbi:hypothetical protein ACH5RR_014858 [Cinchona calisaya]|uniref:DUF4220 domain-containing protein n=1 Tax=Cinchona calisaya TaxID=153742 RepID=A0ABD2ZRG7_9GENT